MEIGRADGGFRRQSSGRYAAETITTACKVSDGLMVVLRGFGASVVVLLGAGFGVDAAEMECSMGVAAHE